MEAIAGYPELCEVLVTEDEIEAILGKPAPRILAKVINTLDDICLAFIARSPFILVASHDATGRVDVSPKGDPAGFVARAGPANDRHSGAAGKPSCRHVPQRAAEFQSWAYIHHSGQGRDFRVSGTARIVRDAWLRERMAVANRLPDLALVVTVEEAFVHCSKCMVRSRMWQPDTWNGDGLASIVEAVITHGRSEMSVAELQALWENDLRTRLY